MDQDGEAAAKELGVTENDFRALRHRENRLRVLLLLAAAAVASMISFILGYVMEMEDPHFSYPYASAAMAASAKEMRDRRLTWAFVLIPLLALLSFFIGIFAADPADPPNYGVAPEYSVFSRAQ